jgi:Terminase large subunit, T4likevirus-type, N-terminal
VNKFALFELIGYQPHDKQRLYHLSDSRFKVPVCGRRFGKSTMGARDAEPQLFSRPAKRIWIVGPTYDLAEREFRVIWDDLIVGQKLGQDKRVKKSYNKRSGDMSITMPWGTVLEAKSAEHPERLVGEALDYVIMSEAAKHKEETWLRYILPALSDKRGGASFPTTPEGYNWLYALWQFGQNPDRPQWNSWRFPTWDNTVMYPGGENDPEILALKDMMTPEAFDQEIGAMFSSFVGKIFPEWDEDTHVTTVPYDPRLPNYVTFDWGYTNPLAAVEFQVDSWDRIRVWRVHYKAYTRLEDHLKLMQARPQPEGYKIDLAFGDAADPEAAATVSRYLAPCIANPEAKVNWRQGIDLIRKFLRLREHPVFDLTDEHGAPIYVPGLYVDHSCTDFIKEMNNYKAKGSWETGNVPEMGQKIADHAIDALRYGLMHVFELGVQHHLSEVYSPSDLVTSGSGDGSFFTWQGGIS